MIIIFGAGGFIGKYVYDYFSKQGKVLAATSHSQDSNLIYFDLEHHDLNDLKDSIDLDKVTHAIILSAITKPDDCKKNPEQTYKINVEGTKKLIEQLWQRQIFPIWFSSEYVFNSDKGNYSEQDEKNPNTVYGGHKQIIEDFLLNSGKKFFIARLGKVFSSNPEDNRIVTSIFEELKNNETIKCATDQIFSTIYVKDLVKLLEVVIEKNLQGLYNVVGPEYFSRFDLAKKIKSQLNIESGKIVPCSIKDFDFIDNRPFNTSLNPEKIIRDTGFEFTKMVDCIKNLGE
tara:strand:- start:480 stop:1340 length:861 start_codon:yes stop_codon:yes gene_type:complete